MMDSWGDGNTFVLTNSAGIENQMTSTLTTGTLGYDVGQSLMVVTQSHVEEVHILVKFHGH